jgi:hypothetical protein
MQTTARFGFLSAPEPSRGFATKPWLQSLGNLGLAIKVLSSGKRQWMFRCQVAGKSALVKSFGGIYPAVTIAIRPTSQRLLPCIAIAKTGRPSGETARTPGPSIGSRLVMGGFP